MGTVRPAEIWNVRYEQVAEGKWRYGIDFRDQVGAYYRLPVTDLAFRSYLDYLRTHRGMSPAEIAHTIAMTLQEADVFLRIGLSRAWKEHPDRCYAQITGVHTFPDYLDGRSFADFSEQPAIAQLPDAGELPF